MMLTQREPKTDEQLQLDVLAELNRDLQLRPAEIGVEVDNGVVTLIGTVSTYSKIARAVEIASRVDGVMDIANKLVVRGLATTDDTQLAQVVREAMLWDADVPAEKIESVVRGGIVTLGGLVDYAYERQAAHDAVARLVGVRGVNNEIIVAPPVRSDDDIHAEIRSTLRRRGLPQDIDVSVDHGAVTLMGKVSAYATRSEVEKAVWGTDGVTAVIDRIVVRI